MGHVDHNVIGGGGGGGGGVLNGSALMVIYTKYVVLRQSAADLTYTGFVQAWKVMEFKIIINGEKSLRIRPLLGNKSKAPVSQLINAEAD